MSRTLFRSLFIVVLFAIAAGSAAAQQIQGEVRYAQTGKPALGVLVHCNGTGGTSEQLTDRNGKFYFRVSPGHYDVYIDAPDYAAPQQSVDLLDKQSSEYMFFRLKLKAGATPSLAPPGTVTAGASANVPSKAREEFDKGSALIGEGKKEKVEEGIGHLEKAISLYPQYLEAELMLGTSYMDLQQWDKAEQALKRALIIDPKTANANFALGELYWQQKKYSDAEKVLQAGLKLEDRSYQGHYALGRVYWAQNDLAKAGPEVGRALQLKPDFAEAHLLAGNILLKARQPENALTEFEEYLRLAPNGEFAPQARELSAKLKLALGNKKP